MFSQADAVLTRAQSSSDTEGEEDEADELEDGSSYESDSSVEGKGEGTGLGSVPGPWRQGQVGVEVDYDIFVHDYWVRHHSDSFRPLIC